MVAGKVCCGFFQELVLHLQFPGLPLELAQPRALANGKRRLFAGMLTAVDARPVSAGAFGDAAALLPSGTLACRPVPPLLRLLPSSSCVALLVAGRFIPP